MPHQLEGPWKEALRADAERRGGFAAAAHRRLNRAIARHGKTAPWLYLLRYRLKREFGRFGAARDVDLAFRADWTCSWALGLGPAPKAPPEAAALAHLARDFAASKAAAPVLAYRGQAFGLRGRRDEGLADLRRAAGLEPAAWILAWLGESARSAGLMDEALLSFDAAVRRDPRHANALGWRATARLQAGDLEGAGRDLDLALRLRPTARFYMDRSRLRRRREDWPGALQDLHEAVRHNPDRGWDGAGPRRDERALAELERAAASQPGEPWFAAWRGRCLLDRGRAGEALEALASALRRRAPQMAWARAWSAEALLELGRADEAREALARALREDPRYAPARLLMAEIHARGGRHDLALAELRRAARSYPYSARLYLMRARTWLGLGRPARARDDAERALRLSPEFPEAAAFLKELSSRRPCGRVFSLRPALERPRSLEFFVNYACNAHCSFCFNPPDASPALLRGLPYRELARRLYAGWAAGYRAVKFIGGEATLRPDLPKLVRLARLIGYESVQLTTNGIRLGDPRYADLLWRAGVDKFRFSIHGHTPELHDRLVDAPGALARIECAVGHLRILGAEIGVNYVLNRINAPALPETCAWIFGRLGVSDMIIYLVRYQGYGAIPENRDALKLSMREAAGPVRAAYQGLRERGHSRFPALIHFTPCALPELSGHMLDWRREPADEDRVTLPDGSGGRIEDVTNSGKRPIAACGECVLAGSCFGVERNYLEEFGEGEFAPLTAAEALPA